MAATPNKITFTSVSGASLSSQPWWPNLHSMINEAFQVKEYSVFPSTWTRLHTDTLKGAEGLAHELGENGYLVVAFVENNSPVACGGVLPFRGMNWINKTKDHTDPELASRESQQDAFSHWEICCFCIHPSARGRGLSHQLLNELIDFVRDRGGKRIYTNYALDETGDFWPRLGFEIIPGAGGILHKGYRPDPARERLKADIPFGMGVKTL